MNEKIQYAQIPVTGLIIIAKNVIIHFNYIQQRCKESDKF